MGAQIHYLKFFRYFWVHNVFIYTLLAITLLSGIYLIVNPADQSSDTDEIRKKIEKQIRQTQV